MKRSVSLLAVVSVAVSLACAGAEEGAWPGPEAEASWQEQRQSLERSPPSTPGLDGESDGGGGSMCPPPEYPAVPDVPDPIELDRWDFAGTPLFPRGLQSVYLVAFASPTDPLSAYVYGLDVAANRFVFAGTLTKSRVVSLTTRVGIDIGYFHAASSGSAKSGMMIDIGGPTPPPPPPNINDPSLHNYGKLAHKVAVDGYKVAGQLSD
jgi:hypothetical protein